MTTSAELGVEREVAAVREALASRRDPSYEAGMRRTVPSGQPAHATRVPEIRKVAAEWLRGHRHAPAGDVLALAEALWRTEWREERIVASMLLGKRKDVLATLRWSLVEEWTRSIDNWEHVDNLCSDLSGPMLLQQPALIDEVRRFGHSENPWQRRTAPVTLIVARRRVDYDVELEAMADQLKKDPHPLVRKAVVWARRELGKPRR